MGGGADILSAVRCPLVLPTSPNGRNRFYSSDKFPLFMRGNFFATVNRVGGRSEHEASPESRYHRKCNDCDVASCATGTQPALRLGWATPRERLPMNLYLSSPKRKTLWALLPTTGKVSLYIAALCLTSLLHAHAEEKLYVATPLTGDHEFTAGIEGPACGPDGSIFAVNFARQQTIGRVTPDGKGEVFVVLPGKNVGNGIRFGPDGFMYVADDTEHNVLRINPKTRAVTVFAHDADMNQLNDLAVASDGTLYASAPDWKAKTGQVWRIARNGTVKRLAQDMGTTNGIELSPDGKTLYVNESVQRKIWAFPVTVEGLGEKCLLIDFPDHGFDGMRCDVGGNLFVTRYGKGTVVVVSPEGNILREIEVLGRNPSNICFGGPDGRTAYVTEVEHRRIIQFRVEKPGLEWLRMNQRPLMNFQLPNDKSMINNK